MLLIRQTSGSPKSAPVDLVVRLGHEYTFLTKSTQLIAAAEILI
jgi:hypothetical protein